MDRRIWPLIFPYLSLCDLECISQTCSTLQELVGRYIHHHGVYIEKCCLRTLPFDIYQKYGQSVSILTLNSLPASEAHNLIGHFNRLSSLTLINMNILEDTEIMNFPLKIIELVLIDCEIEDHVFKWWMTELNCTLRKLHLRNFKFSLSLFVPANYRVVYLDPLNNLESLTIEGNALRVGVNGRKLKYLKIRSSDLADVLVYQTSDDHLRGLHFDVPPDQWKNLKIDKLQNSLQRLTTRNLLSLKELRLFKCLNQLEILQPVEVQFKEDIEALNINTVKVVYNSASHPPEETNLILKKLNEDCLLKIISHLKVSEWMCFGQVHPTIERILTDHKYPREVIKEEDIDESGISKDLSHFLHVAQFITQYECFWMLKYIPIVQHQLTALNSLTLQTVSFKNISIEVLPHRLEKLALLHCQYKDCDLAPYFHRLSPTLRVLDLTGRNFSFRVHWLEPLLNIREFRIDSYDVSADLSKWFLDHNTTSLERFEIEVRNLPSTNGWGAIEDTLDRINRMKKLTHLRIQEADYPSAVNSHLLAEVLKNIGPQLKTLATIFSGPEMKEVLESERLRDLQELEVIVQENYRDMAITAITSLKNLQKLRIEIINPPRPSTLLLPNDLMFLVTSLPKLTAIYAPLFKANLSFGLEFQEYLRRTQRAMRINEVKFPCADPDMRSLI